MQEVRKTLWLTAPVAMVLLAFAGCSRDAKPAAAEEIPAVHQPMYSTSALRICADPNNLPFSNDKLQGFENSVAELLGEELKLPVEYTWWAQRRGFIRNTLKAGKCDVVLGVPNSFELALTSRPYYRSTYVFVSRADRGLDVQSFDDPLLKSLRIGIQLIGDDGANSPPVHALAKRGIINNTVGFTVYGDYRKDSPPSEIIHAVARGDVDVAVAWGPMAGYFAQREKVPVKLTPVSPQIDLPYLPMVYDISLGVRRGEDDLLGRLQQALDKRQDDIRLVLRKFGVPDANAAPEAAARR